VKIHHDDAVLPPPCRPGGTILDAGWVITLITEQNNRSVSIIFFRIFKLMFRKDLLIRLEPDPFDLFLDHPKIRNIVDAVTGINAVSTSPFCGPAFLEIHGHSPPDLIIT
jgi:hypothetical protein